MTVTICSEPHKITMFNVTYLIVIIGIFPMNGYGLDLMRYLISSKYKKLTLSFEAKDISCSLNLFTCSKLICKHSISYFDKMY